MAGLDDGMEPFFRSLDGRCVIGFISFDEDDLITPLAVEIPLTPVNAPVPDGFTLVGRLYVPGRRHCLYYTNGNEVSERGWPEFTPLVWKNGDDVIGQWEDLRQVGWENSLNMIDVRTGKAPV